MVDNLVGGFNPLKNMRSSLGMIFHSQLNGKIIQMFQTTNQNIYLDPPSTWNMGSVIYLSYPHDCWGRPWNYEYLKGLHHEPLLFFNSPAPIGSRCNGSPSHWKGFSAQGENGIGREGSRNGSAAIFSVSLEQTTWMNQLYERAWACQDSQKIWTYRVRTRIV